MNFVNQPKPNPGHHLNHMYNPLGQAQFGDGKLGYPLGIVTDKDKKNYDALLNVNMPNNMKILSPAVYSNPKIPGALSIHSDDSNGGDVDSGKGSQSNPKAPIGGGSVPNPIPVPDKSKNPIDKK